MFELVDNSPQHAVIKVIGVGGGGGNAVQHMVDKQIDGVDFICANTDAQALQRMRSGTLLQLGHDVTKGLVRVLTQREESKPRSRQGIVARVARRCGYGIYYGWHGRWYWNRRGTHRRANRPRAWNSDCRCGDKAFPLKARRNEYCRARNC